ncbi:hypothetical protein DFJ77DRAFT_363962 [Powellomyces hirtus]|nr:hypothetical protein DFJ77DRAFT_363962 [Powellomyces hirtus]
MQFKYLAFLLPLLAVVSAAPLPQNDVALAIATPGNEAVGTQSDPADVAVDNGPAPDPASLAAPPAQAVVDAAATGGNDSIPSRSDRKRL